jgi:tetratricopeptide (TPR) repeat protein
MTELEILIEAEANAKISAGALPALAYFSIGYSARIEQDYPKAIIALHQAMVLQPDNAMYPQALGIAYADAGDNGKAVECFRRCLELRCRGLYVEIPKDNPIFISDGV